MYKVKKSNLEKKLELYYNKLHNAKIVIDNWAILDEKAYNKLLKTTIISINNIFSETYKPVSLASLSLENISNKDISKEIVIFCESKKEIIVFKYNINFIAIRRAETEYGLYTGEYDLIAVNKNYIYENNNNILYSPRQLMNTFKIKLSKKAMKDLEYFQ